MKPTGKIWVALSAAVLVFALMACSCSSLTNLSGGEAMPGLAGSWRHADTTLVCVIQWGQNTYTVTSCILDDGEVLDLTAQSWADGTLSWTMHLPSTGYDLTFQVVSLEGDTLHVSRWGTAGTGTETLQRVP